MKKKQYFYIYKITILTGRLKDHYYIGQHKTTNLNDKYIGSGRKIKDWLKKDRVENVDYIKEILCFCSSWEEMQISEAYYVGDKYETDELCLNLKEGGVQAKLSSESKHIMSEKNKGRVPPNKGKSSSEETIIKLKISHQGQIAWNKGMKGQYKTKSHKVDEEGCKNISNGILNKWQDEEYSNKCKKAAADRVWMNNGEKEKHPKKEEIIKYEALGFVFGRL